jgi:cation transport regulator ChaB
MPYDTLPARYRDLIPAEDGQDIFRRTINSQLAAGKTEAIAFASAWAALERAGYEKGDDGKWMKKTMPTASQVHVPGAEWDDEKGKKRPKVEKAEYRGRTVALDKPFRLPKGSSKKFGVYVKAGDRVKRVTFGDPNMEIRRDDPEARANFRARHSCDTATDKTSARYWSCRMWSASASVGELTKRGLNDDIFTTAAEAAVRGMELGLNGEVHVHQTADGQAVYMPGDSHETYLERMAELGGAAHDYEDDEEDAEGDSESEGVESADEDSEGLLERVISGMLRAAMTYDMNKSAEVLKLDSERRIAWGWASVSTVNGKLVTDTQGDVITPTELGKMADRFMASARTAKAMHEGDQIGEVLHSLPLTNELAKAFGINTDREGWLIGMKIHDDAVWKGFQEGRYRAFSIGGKAKRVPK